MIYLIIFLILNQLAHMFILHVAKVAEDEEILGMACSLKGWLFHSVVGFPLVAMSICGALLDGGKE